MADNKVFSKTDMERVGVFSELGYISINDNYQSSHARNFNEAAGKGKQLLPGGSKDKSAQQHGYFNTKFDRIMEGESYSDPVKMRRQNRIQESKKNIGKPFIPSSGEKKPVGLGSHYGTFAGSVPAFSPNTDGKHVYKAPGRNFFTNPGKKGTGFGYVGVTMNPYYKHETDEYDRTREITKKENDQHKKSLKGGAFRLNMNPQSYFGPNPYKSDRPLPPVKQTDGSKSSTTPFRPSNPGKKAGGMKAGTFDPYPSHSTDVYGIVVRRPVHVVNKTGKTFVPHPGPKTAPQNSIVNHNVVRSVNVQNYKQVTTIVY